MNKFILAFAIAAFGISTAVTADSCTKDISSLFDAINFVDMRDGCVKVTEAQIKMEIKASLEYLNMAAYFSKDSVNRPGFAKLFFDAASEEREHALKLIEYLNMRGRYLLGTDNKKWESSAIPSINISKMLTGPEEPEFDVLKKSLQPLSAVVAGKSTSGLIALQNALKLETAVTGSIRNLIEKCETDVTESNKIPSYNDYHFVDYLTGEFLEEQYKGQRDLAGKISTLGKMVQANGAELADFLFDKQLL